MIRWHFCFNWMPAEEKENVQCDVKTEEEDVRIIAELEDPSTQWLELPGEKASMHVNLDLVKVIIREIIDESVQPTPSQHVDGNPAPA